MRVSGSDEVPKLKMMLIKLIWKKTTTQYQKSRKSNQNRLVRNFGENLRYLTKIQ